MVANSTNNAVTTGNAVTSPTVAAARLHSTVSGAGAPVILLHGLFGMGSNLGALGRSLADRYEVHQLDLPNHGRSPWQDRGGLREMADAVAAYAAQLTQPTRVVGHSLGGKVAMQFAMRHPDGVAGLVVADIAPVSYPASHERVFAGIDVVAAQKPRSRSEAASIMGTIIEEQGVIQFLSMSLRRDDDGVYRWRFNVDALKANYESYRSAPEGSGYSGPSLFIYGQLSTYVDEGGMAAARALFRQARFEALAGTGHWLHVEQPARFNSAVGEFLDSVHAEALG